ncbi:MAG: UDP-N-acetylmuramate--L-alanine ligase [Candidatus Gastranaerophilales bacterium]|nr:UDP-N-acetylmuramate--L-alanine ligase [Candidatus Gastranaerophilales bacterium]
MLGDKNKRFHFIAIGGVGMSGLAKYLLQEGYKVSGSDVSDSKYVAQVRDLGAIVSIGHKAHNVDGADVVIASTAIKADNVEIQRAKELNIPVIHRSDLLQSIAKVFSENPKSNFMGFSGTHGKTTTSGLCSYLLEKAGLKPSFVVGGIIPELHTNAQFASHDYFAAELDESDGTILKYQPDTSVINNLELDHVDFYKNGFEDLLNTFSTYLNNLKPNAKVIINTDCEGNLELMKRNPNKKYITFGLKNADYVAENIKFIGFGSEFNVNKNGKIITTIKLSVPGYHNVYNSLAVFIALYEAGICPEKFVKHFETFSGMGRRFQKSAEFGGITVVDDYAHHPSEIKATLTALKEIKGHRIVAVFQPHRYSRFIGLWDEFLNAFDSIDKLIVVDVFAASEKPLTEADPAKFVKQICHKDAVYISGKMDEAAKKILPLLKPSDIVLTLGAGDVTKIGPLMNEIYNRGN